MALFGERLVAIGAYLIDETTGTFATADNFLSKCGVSGELRQEHRPGPGGRLGYLTRILEKLDEEDANRLQVVLQELAAQLRQLDRSKGIESLKDALLAIGFELADDGRINPSEILTEETEEVGDYLDELIKANEDSLDVTTLRHHLDQHRSLYGQGTSPGAAAGEAREFTEQLLADIANAIAEVRNHTPNLKRPFLVRDYLQKEKFFSEDERKRLVDGVYGFLSEVGAHPGIKDTTMGRMARIVFLNFGVYLLEKFQAFPRSDVEPKSLSDL